MVGGAVGIEAEGGDVVDGGGDEALADVVLEGGGWRCCRLRSGGGAGSGRPSGGSRRRYVCNPRGGSGCGWKSSRCRCGRYGSLYAFGDCPVRRGWRWCRLGGLFPTTHESKYDQYC